MNMETLMGLKISREADGRVSVVMTAGSQTHAVAITTIEARLLAIKLLLAAEDFSASLENRA